MVTQRKTKITAGAYSEGVGRRKTAVARVRIYEKGDGIIINNKDYRDYFRRESLARVVCEPLEVVHADGKVKVSAHIEGGGIQSQAVAIQHGIARALIKQDPQFRKQLRTKNLLTRDPRMKERRKFGLKKARRAPQWSKR